MDVQVKSNDDTGWAAEVRINFSNGRYIIVTEEYVGAYKHSFDKGAVVTVDSLFEDEPH